MAETQTSRQPRRRTVRRWVVRAVVFLLLGAVVNVAVAWGCALAINIRSQSSANDVSSYIETSESGYKHWSLLISQRPGVIYIESFKDPDSIYTAATDISATEAAPSWGGLSDPRFENLEVSRMRFLDARGWPLPSFWCEYVPDPNIDSPTRSDHYRVLGAIDIGLDPWDPDAWHDFGGQQRALPFRPIWRGVIINTIFYAVIVWLLLAAPFALRRRWRVRKGLCVKCAYPVGERAICTECGHTLRRPTA